MDDQIIPVEFWLRKHISLLSLFLHYFQGRNTRQFFRPSLLLCWLTEDYLLEKEPAPQKGHLQLWTRFNSIPQLSFSRLFYFHQQRPHNTYNAPSHSTGSALVFLCRRSVVLVALLLYNGLHSGWSKWQLVERNHRRPGLRLPLPICLFDKKYGEKYAHTDF